MNEEPSGGEFIVLVFALIYALTRGVFYYRELILAAVFARSRSSRWPVLIAPVAGLIILFPVLIFLAAKEVRSGSFYVLLFMVIGAAFMMLGTQVSGLLGISLREDVVEQGNKSASIALAGATLGMLFAYTGGNIGEGPTIGTTIFSSGLASAGLLLLWLLLQVGSGISAAITEERDIASGWRLAGLLMAIGLILGRAVAGDWQSEWLTIKDFLRMGWPAGALTLAALVGERRLQPTLARPRPAVMLDGVLPASLYLIFAVVVLITLGKWK